MASFGCVPCNFEICHDRLGADLMDDVTTLTIQGFHIRLVYAPFHTIKTLRPIQNERYFAEDFFKGIFVNENFRVSIKISLNFVLQGPFDCNSALFQITAWGLTGDKPLSETIVTRLTHICITPPH